MYTIAAVFLAVGLAVQASPADTQAQPADHHSEMMKRGEQGMGFSQEKTTHHFRLYKNGGAIEVEANNPDDSASREEIRRHLSHIVGMFSAGDFNIPMLVHGVNPPGTAVMTKLRGQIHYHFQEMESGGRIQIETKNAKALQAIHSFLRFQIAEHQTGDATDVAAKSTLR